MITSQTSIVIWYIEFEFKKFLLSCITEKKKIKIIISLISIWLKIILIIGTNTIQIQGILCQEKKFLFKLFSKILSVLAIFSNIFGIIKGSGLTTYLDIFGIIKSIAIRIYNGNKINTKASGPIKNIHNQGNKNSKRNRFKYFFISSK